nr:dTMP kinase [Borreliella americana]
MTSKERKRKIFVIKILKNFYCIEGIDGSGKTSIANKLKALCNDELRYYFTKEPSSGIIGEMIRKQLMNFENPLKESTFAYLYAADRHDHLYKKDGILEILKTKSTKIITDRYLFSSIAYQGKLGYELNKNFPLPEKVFFIETAPNIAYERIQNNRTQSDLFELEKYQTFEQIALKYLKIFKKLEKKINVIYIDNSIKDNLDKNAKKIFNLIKF